MLPHGSLSAQFNGAYTARRPAFINNAMSSSSTSTAAGTQTTPAVATPTVTYAMSPGQAVQGLYDYSTNTGMKQWIEATSNLDDKPYDGSYIS